MEMANIIAEEVKYMMRMKSGSSRKFEDMGMELLEKGENGMGNEWRKKIDYKGRERKGKLRLIGKLR